MSNLLRHIPKSLSKLHKNIIPIRGEGSWIYTEHNKYLDFTSGIGALSTGHSHPYILEKISAQLMKGIHFGQLLFDGHPALFELNNKISSIVPQNINNFFYTNCGSEATDTAIKIARRYTGKTNIISVTGGFHGRTIGAMSLTSSGVNSKMKSQPLMPGIFFTEPTIESFERTLSLMTHPDETAGIFMESVQGESGIFSLSKEFMQHCRKVCNKNNIMLITDEVQCGAGRTGTWWNFTQKGITPDIITFGKGIGSGMQMAGVASTSTIMDCGNNYLGGTYGGNALACIASSATIDVIQNENLLDNSIKMGRKIYNHLKINPNIKEIRQHGLMIGIDIDNSHEIIKKLRDNNILVLSAGNKGQYIRLLPPLNVKENEVDLFLETFDRISDIK